MPTLFLTPRYTEDSQALWKAAGNLGWDTERLASWRIPAHLRTLPEPVLYCEALFAPSLAEQLEVELLSPAEDWLVSLPMKYKSRHISLTTLGAARADEQQFFIKPPNDKSFPAGIYRGSELPREYADETPVLVSDIVKWQKEFRCFILQRSLRTYSLYSRDGKLQDEKHFASTEEEKREMEKFIAALLADPAVELPVATVIDVGTLEDGSWACVEQNAAWGAGIYGCHPAIVLEVLRHAVINIKEQHR